jgi:aryl-alcohol dehydrogenase-like predicted oxidoreductase
MFPTLKHFGVGIIPWSILALGLLTRPFNGETTTTTTTATKRGDELWVSFVLATLTT